MTEFQVGDRVRVLSRSRSTFFIGKTGEVLSKMRDPTQGVPLYQVRLDDDYAVQANFWRDELEPAPPRNDEAVTATSGPVTIVRQTTAGRRRGPSPRHEQEQEAQP